MQLPLPKLWRQVQAIMSLIPSYTWLVLLACVLFQPRQTYAQPTVKVRNGTYSGVYLSTWDQDIFLGIPYAQDAGGPNRFRIPQALNETWDDVRQATAYSDQCPDNTYKVGAPYGQSENCLSLNVVRPSMATGNTSSGGLLPVLVWIHGGSYQQGTTGLPQYNLTHIVARSQKIGKPILGVSINYRKGGWGNMFSIEIAVRMVEIT